MFLVAVTAPFLGGIADYAGVRKRMLLAYTVIAVAAILGFSALEPGWIVTGFLLGTIAQFAFEGGESFYNAYLPEIAPPAYRGRVSAWGFALGYAGSLLGLGIALGLHAADALAWLWFAIALQWALGAIPAFRVLPADRGSGVGVLEAAREGARRTLATIREAAHVPALRWFLLAYFFYMDGVNTVIFFAPVYAESTLHFGTVDLLILLSVVQVTALLGSLALARPTDMKGPRWTVRLLLLWWTAVVVAAFFAQTKPAFFVVAALAGLGLGGIQAASRALMASLVPPGSEARMFGLYALCGKTGSILGPILFGTISYGYGQRTAILSIAAMYAVGSALLARLARSTGGPAAA